MGCKSSKELDFSIAAVCDTNRNGQTHGTSTTCKCESGQSSTEVPTQRRRRSLSQILLSAPNKRNENKHRDVFSIFGERGMTLAAPDPSSLSKSLCPQTDAATASSSSAHLQQSHIVSPAATSSSCGDNDDVDHEVGGDGDPLQSDSSMLSSPSTRSDRFIPQLNLRYGAFSDQGMRNTNEDRKVCVSDTIHDHDVAFFGIYDGHGGDRVAQFLAEHLHETVFDTLHKQQEQDLDSGIRQAFAQTDDSIFNQQIESGSTAVSVLIHDQEAVIASIGDSQAVLSCNNRAVLLSVPHTAELSTEKARILAAKGSVVKGRIFGLLQVSRAFGDNDFKTSRGQFKDRFNGDLVTASPDICHHQIGKNDQFIVLGCDGLFDVMTPQEVVDFVRVKLQVRGEVQQVCEELVAHAISLGSMDNVSAIVVCLNAD